MKEYFEEKLNLKLDRFEMIQKEQKTFESEKTYLFSETPTNKGDLSFFFCKHVSDNFSWKLRINMKHENEIKQIELKSNKFVAVKGKFRYLLSSVENEKHNICEINIFEFQTDYFLFFEKLSKPIKSHIFSFLNLHDLNSVMRTNKSNLNTLKTFDKIIFAHLVSSDEKEKTGNLSKLKLKNQSQKNYKYKSMVFDEFFETELHYIQSITRFRRHLSSLLSINTKETVFSSTITVLNVIFFIFFLFLFFFYFLFFLIGNYQGTPKIC